MRATNTYHYTECGLSNVYIEGLPMTDDNGEVCITVPNIQLLHWRIAKDIIESNCILNGEQIRFLRSEMGLACAQFAQLLDIDGALVEKWESQQENISNALDVQLRQAASDALSEKLHNHLQCYLAQQANSENTHAQFARLYKDDSPKIDDQPKRKSDPMMDYHFKLDSDRFNYSSKNAA